MNHLCIRKGTLEDLPAMKTLFAATIMAVCKKDYSATQLNAWISTAENASRWTDLVYSQYLLVAVIEDTICGFASLQDGQYVDMLYVHHSYQRQGIAHHLLDALEKEAVRQQQWLLTSDVSITARSFFEKKSFRVIQEQQVETMGTLLTNYKMQKNLSQPAA